MGFRLPAAAVARLTSEQPNLGQPLPSQPWGPSPVGREVCWGGGPGGGRPQLRLRLLLLRLRRLASCLRLSSCLRRPGCTARGNPGMQMIATVMRLTGIPQFVYLPKVNDVRPSPRSPSPPLPRLSVSLHPPSPPLLHLCLTPNFEHFPCSLFCRFKLRCTQGNPALRKPSAQL